MTNKSSKNKESEQINDVYRDIVVSTNTLIWRTDAEGRFTFLNPAWEKIYNYKTDEMLGKPFSDFQVPEAAGHYINAFRNCLIGESVIGHETTFFSKGGDKIHLAINMIPLYNDTDKIVGIQGTAFDITERKHADDILQYCTISSYWKYKTTQQNSNLEALKRLWYAIYDIWFSPTFTVSRVKQAF